jgi:hypothetical protein
MTRDELFVGLPALAWMMFIHESNNIPFLFGLVFTKGKFFKNSTFKI